MSIIGADRGQGCFADMHQSGALNIQELCSITEHDPQKASLRLSIEIRVPQQLESRKCTEVLQAVLLHPSEPSFLARSHPFNATVLMPAADQFLTDTVESYSGYGQISCACEINESQPWSRQFLGSVFIVRALFHIVLILHET